MYQNMAIELPVELTGNPGRHSCLVEWYWEPDDGPQIERVDLLAAYPLDVTPLVPVREKIRLARMIREDAV